MSIKLQEVLEGREDNYILPFFWQHGEEEDVLREEVAKIYESGIKALCIESRPHPDFLGPKWWADLDIILEEARSRVMKVWILDDDHFPTGHAAGRLAEAPRELRRQYLSEFFVDAIGPRTHSSFVIAPIPHVPGYSNGGVIKAVIAVRRDPESGKLTDEAVDVTDFVENDKLYWDVPEGYWRIFSIVESEYGGDPAKSDYVNNLVANSVKILIDTVYEAFYERYRDDFGQTLAGFFSDEPGFYNDKDTWDFNSKPGKKGVTLPWCDELFSLLEEKLGSEYKAMLPLLWHEGESSNRVRYHYMNIVSQLYAKNFTEQIGNWCRSHGVEYIGHVLEDNNVHSRLGSGAAHFYRALGGQDMSGLDVVLWQLRPGFDKISTRGLFSEGDAEFFNYGMAKMAVSLAHLDPKKKGRTMAEVFGAYGWTEGLKLMKWLTDHMLVRGVNYFVPHAFSAKEYPDMDCPPHLYARGKNPQFRYYKYLNHYTNRLSHLLTDGTHVATAAVLYHAEAEWSGDFMLFQKPVKELLQNQIDCDILPCDTIIHNVSVRERKLCMQKETFDCLIIPYSEALPASLLERLIQLADEGLPIFFVNGFPCRSSEENNSDKVIEQINTHENTEIVKLETLVERLKKSGYFKVETKSREPYLRSFHIQHSDMDVFMFFNEHPYREINTEIYIPVTGELKFYDAYQNKLYEPLIKNEGNRILVDLKLGATETVVLVAGPALEQFNAEQLLPAQSLIETVEGSWLVSTATSEQYPVFHVWREMKTLMDVSRIDGLPGFTGTIRYETEINLSPVRNKSVVIDLGDVFETAEVFINDGSAGVRIAAPYRFEISHLLKEGTNSLTIEVTNTLVQENPDFFSRMAQLEPSGLLGPVRLLTSGT